MQSPGEVENNSPPPSTSLRGHEQHSLFGILLVFVYPITYYINVDSWVFISYFASSTYYVISSVAQIVPILTVGGQMLAPVSLLHLHHFLAF